ncbi:MAG: hypothetical protein K9J32_06255, partial [Synechococcus lacustris]|nr:hypothetical protein [Synechococcus lacustris]
MAFTNQVINLKVNLLSPPVVTKAALVYCEGTFAGLDGTSNGIPIVADLATALALKGPPATTFIYGMAPATGLYGDADR